MAANVPINTSSIQSLLRPGLASVFSDMDTYPDQWKEIFAFHTSDKAAEFDVEMKLLPIAQVKYEGGPIATEGMQQYFVTPYQHAYVGMSYIITRQALMDNLYKDSFPRSALTLKESLREFKNSAAGNVFNNATNSLFPLGDGQPLLSIAHPIIGGTVANTFSAGVQLNETSLEDALIQSQLFLNAAALRVGADPKFLLVPPQLQFVADILLNSNFRPGTANNDINPIKSSGLIRDGFRVNHYINIPSFWGICHRHPNGFKYYERENLTVDMFPDITTNNITVSAIERYSFGCSDFRAFFGSIGF